MKSSLSILQRNNFSQSYFSDRQLATVYTPVSHDFSVIKTNEHYLSCKNAVSPHMLDFFMLCFIRKGEGIYHFGKDVYYLRENTLCYIQPYTLTSWHSQTSFQEGFCCTFSEAFFNDGTENKSWLRSAVIPDHAVVSLSETEATYFNVLLEDMEKEYSKHSDKNVGLIRSQLHALIRKTASLLPVEKRHIAPKSSVAVEMVKSFLQNSKDDLNDLISGKITTLPSLQQHAERLHVSPNHMNDTVKNVLGKPAGQHLQDELALVASGLLTQTNLTVLQIADRLGFSNASYFGRFFKKQTGMSPSEFREQKP